MLNAGSESYKEQNVRRLITINSRGDHRHPKLTHASACVP